MNSSALLSRFYLFFACGDAVGKATEFMTLDDISRSIGKVTGLIDPSLSLCHPELQRWEATDDTQQNVWLLKRYLKDGDVTVSNTVDALVDWINKTDAISKKYIGPSSLSSLTAIQKGADPSMTGINGTTCGGIMRVPAAVFASRLLNLDLCSCIKNALLCTHNNSIAMESACAYAYALSRALDGPCSSAELLSAALEGCSRGLEMAPWISAGPSLKARLNRMISLDVPSMTEDELKSYLYYELGTGLPSYEVAGAVFAVAMKFSDPVKAMFFCAELGGDTDTIGALSCALVSMLDRTTRMPSEIASEVYEHNDLEIL